MAKKVLIEAEPGSGKSTSIETLNPETTFIINPGGKDLPFQGWKKKYTEFSPGKKTGNYAVVSRPVDVAFILNFVSKEMPKINTIVIDDWSFLATFEFMDRLSEKGYEKFNSIAYGIYNTATIAKDLRDDLIVFYLTHHDKHESADGDVTYKARTVGKLVSEKVDVESLFTVVLFGKVRETEHGMEYLYQTRPDGKFKAKSPKGMFIEKEIPNDLELVRKTIIAYSE